MNPNYVILSSFQAGKRFLPVLGHYLAMLYPPTTVPPRRALTSPAPPPKTRRQRDMNLARVEWEDPAPASPLLPSWATTRETPTIATEDLTINGRASWVSTDLPLQSPRNEIRKETRNRPTKQHTSGEQPPRPRQEDVEAPTPPPQHSPAKKRRRLHSQEATRPEINNLVQTIDTTKEGASSLTGRIEHGQTTQISEDEVLGYKDLRVEAYKFSALLRHDKTYQLIKFIARF